jgi:hypothetical protein
VRNIPGALQVGFGDNGTGYISASIAGAVLTAAAASGCGSGSTTAVELADGGHCELIEGAGNVTANLRENYDCTNGVTLYSNASHATQPWTIFGRHGTTGQLTPQSVGAMWY